MSYCNIYGNEVSGNDKYILNTLTYQVFINYSIFEFNNAWLLFGNFFIAGCYIKHSNLQYQPGLSATFTMAITTAVSTPTYDLEHFSTFGCFPLPDQLEITPCQTLPTECLGMNSINNINSFSVSSVLQFFFIGLINI